MLSAYVTNSGVRLGQWIRSRPEAYKTHGHTKMPPDYVAEGAWLRRWLSEQKAGLSGKPTGRAKTVEPCPPSR